MVVSIIDLHVCAFWHVTVNALNWGHRVHMVLGGIEIPYSILKIVGWIFVVAAKA
ncbi:MAG: hypothetical protein MK295_03900 [Pseudomonadales bacterium]|nr:hypothetical protein [Pseudomonadales bacterium]